MAGIDANGLMRPARTVELHEIAMTGGYGDMTAQYPGRWKNKGTDFLKHFLQYRPRYKCALSANQNADNLHIRPGPPLPRFPEFRAEPYFFRPPLSGPAGPSG
ncbi:hypothetical protein [Paraburkholderia sp.]|uniref:hypothetical protein n=1 Tax=Paraburkholderia sp. TaxID=1926495 RepID=UPI0025E47E42|nr:hypothetical protein [Paraburkholderia sp.]